MGLYRFTWKGRRWFTVYNDRQVKKIIQLFSFLRGREGQKALKGEVKKEVKIGDALLMDCLMQGYVSMKPILIPRVEGKPRSPVIKVISLSDRGYKRFHKELEDTLYFKAHREEILANRKPASQKFYEDAIAKSAAKLEGNEEEDKDDWLETLPEEP